MSRNVPFDTDMGNDVDDVLALAMFYRYAEEGKSDLLGIVVNKNEPMAVEACLPSSPC